MTRKPTRILCHLIPRDSWGRNHRWTLELSVLASGGGQFRLLYPIPPLLPLNTSSLPFPSLFKIHSICPGLNLADASVFISCAMTLAVFDITKAVENGDVVEPEVEYTSGTIRCVNPLYPLVLFRLTVDVNDLHECSHPKPFKCSIKPRSEKAVTLILSDGLFGDV